MADSKASFLWAIKQQESGGDYRVVNSGSGALGAYQVMPSNVASWTQQALGRALTPQQFLADNTAQDRVAETILGGYYDKYGARGAAAMWYSGQPDPNKTYGSPSVSDYVSEVIGRMSSSSPVGGTTSANGNTTQVGVTDSLADGLSTGLTSAFKAVLGPVFMWIGYFSIAFVGIGLIVIGAFLMVRETGTFKSVKSAVTGEEPKQSEQAAPAAPATPAPRKKATKKTASRPRKRRMKKSTSVAFQTPAQASQTSPAYGPAHPSYNKPTAVQKAPKKRVKVSSKIKGGASATVATRVGKRVVKARVKPRKRRVRRG